MHFFNIKGKQHLDLAGDLILTHNEELVSTRNKSAGPAKVTGAKYILLSTLTRWQKVKATFRVIGHVWDRGEAKAAATRFKS